MLRTFRFTRRRRRRKLVCGISRSGRLRRCRRHMGRRYVVSRRERRCCRRVYRRARRRRRVFPSVRQNRVLRNRRAVSVRRGWCRSLGFFILRKEGDRRRIGRIGRRLREHLVFRLGRKRRGRLPPDIRISYDGIRHRRRRMRTLLYPADGRRRSGEGK